MSRAEIIKIVGREAVKESNGNDVLDLTAAPKSHPDFEEYLLKISPSSGLLKVIAVSKDIETDDYGIEVQDSFHRIESAISAKYGEPKDRFDRHLGDLFEKQSQWMMALLEKNRVLSTYWFPNPPINGVAAIALEAKALDSKKAYVTVGFEFVGWHDYVEAKKAGSDATF